MRAIEVPAGTADLLELDASAVVSNERSASRTSLATAGCSCRTIRPRSTR